MPLFSVDYTFTHLASCREIGTNSLILWILVGCCDRVRTARQILMAWALKEGQQFFKLHHDASKDRFKDPLWEKR